MFGFDGDTMVMSVYNTNLAITGTYIMEIRASLYNGKMKDAELT